MFSISLWIPTLSTNVPHFKHLWVYLTWILKIFGDVLNVYSWVKTCICGLGKLVILCWLQLWVTVWVGVCYPAMRWTLVQRVTRLSSEDSWDRLQTQAVDDGQMDNLRQLAVLMVSINRLFLIIQEWNCAVKVTVERSLTFRQTGRCSHALTQGWTSGDNSRNEPCTSL